MWVAPAAARVAPRGISPMACPTPAISRACYANISLSYARQRNPAVARRLATHLGELLLPPGVVRERSGVSRF
jgi:hypothetical protein